MRFPKTVVIPVDKLSQLIREELAEPESFQFNVLHLDASDTSRCVTVTIGPVKPDGAQ